ncbi:hypothetical protein P8625_04115 [Tenacibaculum tangerinum]|uniref:Uncharacterized protein n=1 Tax=Tenacibaculum tangerinum TaxID=3038772 RepID=A0ABY8L4K4_9FLAO|nr:hypothetical protein [Tenacibaculum tangerinum]WGH76358.1 hypothetical protein P8625_04115 [Tenacibaculum tangerinum]
MYLKKILFIATILFTSNIFSQDKFEEAKLILRDSTEIVGFAKASKKKILFKLEKEGKKKI